MAAEYLKLLMLFALTIMSVIAEDAKEARDSFSYTDNHNAFSDVFGHHDYGHHDYDHFDHGHVSGHEHEHLEPGPLHPQPPGIPAIYEPAHTGPQLVYPDPIHPMPLQFERVDCLALGLHACVSDGKCVPKTAKCDTIRDCADNSDEEGCMPECKFVCLENPYKCLPETEICNGFPFCWPDDDMKYWPGKGNYPWTQRYDSLTFNSHTTALEMYNMKRRDRWTRGQIDPFEYMGFGSDEFMCREAYKEEKECAPVNIHDTYDLHYFDFDHKKKRAAARHADTFGLHLASVLEPVNMVSHNILGDTLHHDDHHYDDHHDDEHDHLFLYDTHNYGHDYGHDNGHGLSHALEHAHEALHIPQYMGVASMLPGDHFIAPTHSTLHQACYDNEFLCTFDNTCIHKNKVCDRRSFFDCTDGEDEFYCEDPCDGIRKFHDGDAHHDWYYGVYSKFRTYNYWGSYWHEFPKRRSASAGEEDGSSQQKRFFSAQDKYAYLSKRVKHIARMRHENIQVTHDTDMTLNI